MTFHLDLGLLTLRGLTLTVGRGRLLTLGHLLSYRLLLSHLTGSVSSDRLLLLLLLLSLEVQNETG